MFRSGWLKYAQRVLSLHENLEIATESLNGYLRARSYPWEVSQKDLFHCLDDDSSKLRLKGSHFCSMCAAPRGEVGDNERQRQELRDLIHRLVLRAATILAISKDFKGMGAIVTGLAKCAWWQQQREERERGIKIDRVRRSAFTKEVRRKLRDMVDVDTVMVAVRDCDWVGIEQRLFFSQYKEPKYPGTHILVVR